VTTPDALNLIGLALDGSAALLLLISAPIPQRVTYMHGHERTRDNQRKDRITRMLHRAGLIALATGFFLQLLAQVLR
jgi:hypothetical protein